MATPTGIGRQVVRALGTVCLVLSGFSAVSTVPATAAPVSCPAYRAIAARGSGQQYGRSREVATTLDFLERRAEATKTSFDPANAELTDREYRAISVNPLDPGSVGDRARAAVNAAASFFHTGPYVDSVRGGVASTETRLRAIYKDCGNKTKVILIGYSQGAEVMHRVAKDTGLDAKFRSLIAGSIMYGSPLFDPSDPAATGTFDRTRHGVLGSDRTATSVPTISVCHEQDPICQGVRAGVLYVPYVGVVLVPSDFSLKQHYNYAGAGSDVVGDTAGTVNTLTRRLGWAPPPPTAGAGGPLDLVFVIDTTGSMGDDIDSVRSAMSDIVARLHVVSSSWRVAVVDYKDDPDNESDYQARLDQGFTTNQTDVQNAIDALEADGGGDTPESVYSGVMLGIAQPWRTGVAKALVVMGDAPAKDPEPVTGYTLADVQNAAHGVSITPGRRAMAAATDTNPAANVYTVVTGDDEDAIESLNSIADVTGANAYVAPTSDFASQAVSSAVTAAGAGVVVDPRGPYSAAVGVPVQFSGAASSDASGSIASYKWDFGDGETSESSSSAFASHAYADSGDYTATLTVTTDSGLDTTSAAVVNIASEPSEPPASPTDAHATANADGSVSVSWTPVDSYDGTVAGYGVYNAAGDLVTVADGDASRATVRYLPLGAKVAFRVQAIALAGQSAASSPSATVTPQLSSSLSLSTPKLVTTGGTATATGRLLARGGKPLSRAKVVVYRRNHGVSHWTRRGQSSRTARGAGPIALLSASTPT